MRVCIFAVYDSKAAVYSQPFFSQSAASGIRAFEHVVNDREHAFGRNPEDYTLFQIGEWDDVAGALIPAAPAPVALGLATQFVRVKP